MATHTLRRIFPALLITLIIVACASLPPTPTQTVDLASSVTPTQATTSTPAAIETPLASATPTRAATATSVATAVVPTTTPTTAPISEGEVDVWPFPGIQLVDILPTVTPVDEGNTIPIAELPLDDPGEYVNVTFGYWLHYPPQWYTHFGNRPLLISFSNLNPGEYNRPAMRAEGCLIEINADSNIYGFSLDSLMAQLPLSFPNAEEITLGGRPALRSQRSSGDNPFESETIFVQGEERLLIITFEYARSESERCRPAWNEMIASWRWIEADFVSYRNPQFGYSISYPRRWFSFNARDTGVSISNQDPNNVETATSLAQNGLLIHTTVFANEDNQSLQDWVISYEGAIDLTDDIPLGDITGIRVVRSNPGLGLQEMSGYFMGPLGRIYVVNCVYPLSRQWELRPIANAVIYSFEF